jgi:hypothetical protein
MEGLRALRRRWETWDQPVTGLWYRLYRAFAAKARLGMASWDDLNSERHWCQTRPGSLSDGAQGGSLGKGMMSRAKMEISVLRRGE